MDGLIEGRIVHYVLKLEGLVAPIPEYAAIVSRVHNLPNNEVRLHVFTENTTIVVDPVPYDADKAQGTWHWIEGG
jgi:hypothetical protein